MQILIILLVSTVLSTATQAQSPAIKWGHAIHSGVIGDYQTQRMAVDRSGNQYVIGSFMGAIDVDPGPEEHFLITDSNFAGSVVKYSPGGDLIWARKISNRTVPIAIALDSHHNVIIAGFYSDTAQFDTEDPESRHIAIKGRDSWSDIFVLKLSSAGEYQWVSTLAGEGYSDLYSVAAGRNGDIAIAGQAWGDHNITLSREDDNISDSSVYIIRFDSAGAFLSKWFGEGWTDINLKSAIILNVVFDVNNEIYFSGSLFLPRVAPYVYDNGNLFFGSLKSNKLNWTRILEGNSSMEIPYRMIIDRAGSLVIGGSFRDTIDIDPGIGEYNLYAKSQGAFLSRFDAQGQLTWAKTIDGSRYDAIHSVAVDDSLNIYVGGYYQDDTDFDPGPAIVSLAWYYDWEGFAAKYTMEGHFVWAGQLGSHSADRVWEVAVDSFGGLYLRGDFFGAVDADPCPGDFSLLVGEKRSEYLVKWDESGCFNRVHRLAENSSIECHVNGEILMLVLQPFEDTEIEVRIVDLLGKTVHSSTQHSTRARIDIGSLAAGRYFVQLTQAGRSSVSQSFVKL